jgi:hypothetical protein
MPQEQAKKQYCKEKKKKKNGGDEDLRVSLNKIIMFSQGAITTCVCDMQLVLKLWL